MPIAGERLRPQHHPRQGHVAAPCSPSGEAEYDPPGPSPKRCFELGPERRAGPAGQPVARRHRRLVQLVARLPHRQEQLDLPRRGDRQGALRRAQVRQLHGVARPQAGDLEASGENELLNWIPLAGAMHELDQKRLVLRVHRELADELLQVRGAVPAEVVNLRHRCRFNRRPVGTQPGHRGRP